MRMPAVAVFVLLLVLAGSTGRRASAQVTGVIGSVPGALPDPPPPQPRPGQAPVRDRRPTPPRTGTGVVRGRVVDGIGGQPMVHAHVRLGGVPNAPTIVTDASGAFEFTRLPAGRVNLWVYKAGYGASTYPESGRTMRNLGGALILADGQTLDKITVPIYRAGAISGRLVDPYGDPIENATVQAIALPGAAPTQIVSATNANDNGEFRVGRLQPGSYLLVAAPSGGRNFGADEPAASVPTYYPGVLSPDQAQPITVERGQTITGMDFQVIEQPVTSVTGTVTDSTGQPAAGGRVSAIAINNLVGGGWNGDNQIRPGGTFELKLPPGDYRLSAFVNRRDQGRDSTVPAQFDDRPQQGLQRITVGSEPLSNVLIAAGFGSTISGRFVFEGLDGDQPPDPARISISAHEQRPAVQTAHTRRGTDECRANGGKVNPADLTFTIEGVYGTCILSVGLGGSTGVWGIKSATWHGADLLDRPVDLGNQQNVRDVQVTFTTKRTELAAEVTDEQGATTPDYVLMAFSTERSRWSLYRWATASAGPAPAPPAGPGAGQNASGVADGNVAMAALAATNGAILTPGSAVSINPANLRRQRPGYINTLPVGDYYVVAVDDVSYEDVHDPAYLEQLVPAATRVTLREGEPQTLQLRRIKAPPSASAPRTVR